MANKQTKTLDRIAEIETEIKSKDLSSLRQVWEIGKLLAEAKELLPHGEYTPFVVKSFGWSMGYAARLVRLYGEYPDGPEGEGVGVSILLLTLSLDEQVRKAVNQICATAELTKAEAEKLVESLKADKEKLESKVAELRAKVETMPEEREKLKAELRAELESDASKEAKKASKLAKQREEEVGEFRDLNEKLQAEAATLRSAKAEAEKKLTEALQKSKQAESLNRELIEAREQASNLKAELDKARSQSAVAKVERVPVIEAPADYEPLKREVEQLRSSVERFRASAESRTFKVEQLLKSRRLLRGACLQLIDLLTAHKIASPVTMPDVESMCAEVSE